MKIYHDNDADLKVFDGKKVAVLGYGSQGRAQALCFHDSGIDVTIGARKDGKSWNKAKEDGLKVACGVVLDEVVSVLPVHRHGVYLRDTSAFAETESFFEDGLSGGEPAPVWSHRRRT